MLGVTPPPAGARFHGHLPKLGAPVHIAEYADGVHICAYPEPPDPSIGSNGGRRYLPWQWGPERQDYVQRALPNQPRPLYRAQNLELHPDWPVFVFEREDMVDAFHTLSGDAEVIATTIPGGISAFELGEWAELNGRRVVFWPTHAPECEQAMQHVGRTLDKAGSKVQFLTIPQDRPKGWSFLDVVAAEWSWESVERFVREQLRAVEKQLQPIGPAHTTYAGNGAAAPAVAEKQVRQQPQGQILTYRDSWTRIKGLQFAPNQTPYSHLHNLVCAVESLAGRYADVWYDEFHCAVMTDEQSPRKWTENDTYELTTVLQGQLGFAGARDNDVYKAVTLVASKRPRHEVREWLSKLSWDGDLRLVQMLHAGWGAEAHPYTSAVGRCFLIGAVARIFTPGCQVDHVPVFQGGSGIGKTSSLRILFGLRWFDNPTSYMGEKDFLQNMNGKWCLELGELANIKGRALETVKSTITRMEDTYRAVYGRTPGTYKRQCIFAGTIDRGGWNADRAGGRRWWPVKCATIDLEWIAANRDQLFAEAVDRFKDGESWHNVPHTYAEAQQLASSSGDLWLTPVRKHLAERTETDLQDILQFALEIDKKKDWEPRFHERLTAILSQLGWEEGPNEKWTRKRSAT